MDNVNKTSTNNVDITVIGLGYIGLPTAAFLANADFSVKGVDTNHTVVKSINEGAAPFSEPDFRPILEAAAVNGFTADTVPHPSDTYIIAVPTPFTSDHELDFSFISNAVESISKLLRPGNLVILESTSPPGTTARVETLVHRLRPDLLESPNPVLFAHCPERVLPGKIVEEMTCNARIVGGLSAEATAAASAIYSRLSKGVVLETDAKTAELVKLTENAFRDVNIAFANELSLIANNLGVDIWELIDLANQHPRVDILEPGPGVGGHCIAIDPWFIVSSDPHNAKLIRSARAVNDRQPQLVANQIRKSLESTKGEALAVLGLSFKANVGDLRESPSVKIVEQLARSLPHVRIFVSEPNISVLPAELIELSNVKLCSYDEAIDYSDHVALLVEHAQFREIEEASLQGKTVFDTKGFWRKKYREES